jgi:hypothetical protein
MQATDWQQHSVAWVPGGHGEKEARFPADIISPTTALAATASKRGALADMDKAAIDIAKALMRLSELTIFELIEWHLRPAPVEGRMQGHLFGDAA